MAGKPLNRLDLRRQREAAEPLDPMEDETDEVVEEVEEDEVVDKKPKKKAKAPAKSKAKSSRSASKPTARMRIVWAVLNDAFKPVATFDYTQKEAAETRAAELTAKGKGTHFVRTHQRSDARRRPRNRSRHSPSCCSDCESLTRQSRGRRGSRSKTKRRSRRKKRKSKSRKQTTTKNKRPERAGAGSEANFTSGRPGDQSTIREMEAHGDSNTGPHPTVGAL